MRCFHFKPPNCFSSTIAKKPLFRGHKWQNTAIKNKEIKSSIFSWLPSSLFLKIGFPLLSIPFGFNLSPPEESCSKVHCYSSNLLKRCWSWVKCGHTWFLILVNICIISQITTLFACLSNSITEKCHTQSKGKCIV